MAPSVSAIITTYNYAHFIASAVESVLQQTRRPDEIVVIDDGSTDETANIVARYADAGVRYVFQPNAGAGAARNRGLSETSGDLIAFLDADDRWSREKTELQLAHFARYPKAGLVSGSEWQIYPSGRPQRKLNRKATGAEIVYPLILVENTIGNPSLTMVRRACFDRVGQFDEALRLGQDWDMWIRIAREFQVGVVGKPLIYFLQHEGSLTAGGLTHFRPNREIHRRYIGQIEPPLARTAIWLAAQSMNYYYAAAALVDEPTKRRRAMRLAAAATLLDPTYKTRLKFGVLFRAAFGQAAFKSVRRLFATRD
jgi:glycosyltransferase involved in cell wall biosynthesis